MSGGSSPYTVERSKSPCTSLTQRPPWRSIAGMISNTRDGRHGLTRGALGDQFDEILVDSEANAGAFLRVELGREDILVSDNRGEADAVVGLADDHRGINRIDVKRVHEVEVLVVRDAFEQGMRLRDPDRVPADVR